MRLRGLLLLLCLSIATTAVAADGRTPWTWTNEERAKALQDPALRAERLRQRAAELKSFHAAIDTPSYDFIDGKAHPELLFPTQLFEDLVRLSFVTLPKVFPRVVHQYSSDLFQANPAEWARFGELVADYATLLQRQKQLLHARGNVAWAERTKIDAELQQVRARECTTMAAALRACRKEFGRERFDRMLYEVIPPSSGIAVGAAPGEETDPGSMQRYVRASIDREDRCQ